MSKQIISILLLLIPVFVSAQSKNTILSPIKLSPNEIEVVLKEIERYEPKYDSTVHLVWATQNKHYHSDVQEETKAHSIRSSLGYAEALLDSRKPEYHERAFNILRAVIALQDQDEESKTYGVWPYSLEEPLVTKKSPADLNWADFCAIPIIGIINNHSDILPNDLKEKTQKALLLASQAIRKRDVRPDYTNISLTGLYVCYMSADMYNDTVLMDYARKRLKAFYECTVLNKGFIEYNSPVYFKVSLDEVLRLKKHVVNTEDLAMLEFIYHTGWNVIARHYHQPTAQWAGPHGRAYSVLLGSSTYNWFYTASGGIVHPETSTEFSKDQDPILKHEIPVDLIPYFTQPKLPGMEIDTFIRGGQKIELNPLVSYQEIDRGLWIETKEVIGKSGKLNFRIELPYQKFGDYQGSWSTGGDDKNKWVDFVIYSGNEKEFNFGKIQEAVFGILFSMQTGTIAEAPVEVSKSDENLHLKWKDLSVKALSKPYSERATLVLK